MADIEKFVYYDNGSKKVIKPTDRVVLGSGGIAFEGDNSDGFETELSVAEPTADRTITFPDASGTVLLSDGSYTMPENDGTNGQILTTDGSGNLSFQTQSSGEQQRLYYQVNQNQSNPITLSAPSTSYFDAVYSVNCSTGFPFDLNVFTANSVPSGFKITIKGGVVVNDVITVKCSGGFVLQSNPSTNSSNFKITRAGYTKTFISNGSGWYELDENELSYSNDVYLANRAVGDILTWDGNNWANSSISDAVDEQLITPIIITSSSPVTGTVNRTYIFSTASGNKTLNLPDASDKGGQFIRVLNYGSNSVIIDAYGTGTIDGQNTKTLSDYKDYVTLVARGSGFNSWYILNEKQKSGPAANIDVNTFSSNTTLTAPSSEILEIVRINDSNLDYTITLPALSTLQEGLKVTVRCKVGGGNISISPSGSDTINGSTSNLDLYGGSKTIIATSLGWYEIASAY